MVALKTIIDPNHGIQETSAAVSSATENRQGLSPETNLRSRQSASRLSAITGKIRNRFSWDTSLSNSMSSEGHGNRLTYRARVARRVQKSTDLRNEMSSDGGGYDQDAKVISVSRSAYSVRHQIVY